jgi:gamma-glutamylcyclotransferase
MQTSESPFYFAYGSNMSSRRLQERVPTALPYGVALARDKRLVCNRRSRDGSGKANLSIAPGAAAWGVLYRLEARDWNVLDRFEPGYSRLSCEVFVAAESASPFGEHAFDEVTHIDSNPHVRVPAQIYLWQGDGPEIQPFDWYRKHLLDGAREHGLPDEHIRVIETIGS